MLAQNLPGICRAFWRASGPMRNAATIGSGRAGRRGSACTGCGHDRAWAHRARLIDEGAACGRQHSLLKGTIFEQTKTGLAKWFLAIYLVTSSKGGISAMELKRQMGFGSYQTAWSWLHKIRKAMVAPGRRPLAARVEADETYVGGPRPGRPGRGAAGKTRVAGAVESGRGQAQGRRLGRLRLAVVPDVSARSLEGFIATAVAKPATVATDGWSGYGGLGAAGYGHEPVNLAASWGDAALRLPAIHLVFGLAKRWLLGTHHGAVGSQASARLSRRVRVPLQSPHRQEHQPPLRPPDRARRADPTHHLPHPRRRASLRVMDS